MYGFNLKPLYVCNSLIMSPVNDDFCVLADSTSAVNVRRNSGWRDGHAAGTFSDQSAALDSDGTVGETSAVMWQPAHGGNFQVRFWTRKAGPKKPL